jgi:hypothetical protein
MSETLKIYWTPGNFKLQDESWSYLYNFPEQVEGNKFVIKSNIDDQFKLPMEEINRIQKGKVHRGAVESDAMLAIFQPDRSDIPEHALIQYNMNWQFFTDEPVKLKTSLPKKDAPVTNAIFKEQTQDISLWYNQFGLRYNIPLTSQVFDLKAGTPLLYLEVDTDKEVEFVRYNQSTELYNIAEEYFVLRQRYGRATTDEELEERIRSSRLNEILLSYIRKNVI